MGIKLRWFRARMNFSSTSTTRDFSAPSHGLYRSTYSVYEADTLSAASHRTQNVSRADAATKLAPKQVSRSMPNLGDAPSPPFTMSIPRDGPPQTQQGTLTLHNPHAQEEIAVAINPAFANHTFKTAPQETAKTKNRLQLKLNIPESNQNHTPSETLTTTNASQTARSKVSKSKLAPPPPKQGQNHTSDKKKKNKAGKKELLDLQFGGESES